MVIHVFRPCPYLICLLHAQIPHRISVDYKLMRVSRQVPFAPGFLLLYDNLSRINSVKITLMYIYICKIRNISVTAKLSGINQQEPFVLFQVTQLSLGVKTTAKSIVVNSANFANFANFANEKREALPRRTQRSGNCKLVCISTR